MDQPQLEDFIAMYPAQDDPRIKDLISAKKEFVELASGPTEDFIQPGQLFKSQRIFIRLMRAYDRILNIAETGTGKSCQLIGTAEFFKAHRGHYRGAIVIQKPSTIDDFRYQIMCKCSGDAYMTESLKRSETDQGRRSVFTRLIRDWYTIVSYYEFSKMVAEFGDNTEALSKRFSGYIFFIDEAHNLRNDGLTRKQDLGVIYENIHRVFQVVKRSKIVVSTATPMINTVQEFPRILNLVLPPEHQLPTNWNYERVTFAQLEPWLRGKVFYIRNLETGAVPEDQGSLIEREPYSFNFPPEDWGQPEDFKLAKQPRLPVTEATKVSPQTVIYPTLMGDWQNEVYLALTKDLGNQFEAVAADELADSPFIEEDAQKTQFYIPARQASCFVFPPWGGNPKPSYGGTFPRRARKDRDLPTDGLGAFVASPSSNEYTFRDPAFKAWLGEKAEGPIMYPNMYRCSSKYATILQLEAESLGEPGCTFAYVDYVVGSGAVIFGLCYEACGYERFNERLSVFEGTAPDETRTVCATSDGSRRIKANFPKKLRYGLLTSETPETVIDSMLDVFNSVENIDGEYIRAIICTPVARDGINIYNVTRGHLITPGWHPSGMHQAMSRFMRAVSHDNLVRRAGGPVKVRIFKHAAIPSIETAEGLIQHPTTPSVDVLFYLNAESKNIPIRRMMRILKRLDIGSRINAPRNIRPTDVDYSDKCDYTLCRYETATLPKTLDHSTYDAFYADEIVEACISDLTELLRQRGEVAFVNLELREKYRDRFIFLALDRMLVEKRAVLDRYGFKAYLATDGRRVYLQREFPLGSRGFVSNYAGSLIAIRSRPFERIVSEQRLLREEPELQKIITATTPEAAAELLQRLGTLHIDSQVRLLEEALIGYAQGQTAPYIDLVRERYAAFVYHTYEPLDDIDKARRFVIKEGVKKKIAAQGKTRPKFDFRGFRGKAELFEGQPTSLIYIHILYCTVFELTHYAVTSNFKNASGRIRIYKVGSPEGFRDANKYEALAYINIVQKDIERKMEVFKDFKYFGSLLQDRKFRIHLNDPNPEEDQRQSHRGKECRTWTKYDLLEILVDERIRPEDVPETKAPEDREALLGILHNLAPHYSHHPELTGKRSPDELQLLIDWLRSKMASKNYICETIERFFTEANRMLVI